MWKFVGNDCACWLLEESEQLCYKTYNKNRLDKCHCLPFCLGMFPVLHFSQRSNPFMRSSVLPFTLDKTRLCENLKGSDLVCFGGWLSNEWIIYCCGILVWPSNQSYYSMLGSTGAPDCRIDHAQERAVGLCQSMVVNCLLGHLGTWKVDILWRFSRQMKWNEKFRIY